MDSLTHVVLGASLGELVLGRALTTPEQPADGLPRRRWWQSHAALAWGAVLGSLPDLDVVAAPFLDDLGFLTHHRGDTHALLTVILAAPVIGWLLRRLGRQRWPQVGFARWTIAALLCLLTHVLLDACTTYGTPLLLPFSDRRVAWNNLFIIDPLFTLPLLVGAAVAWQSRNGRRRAQAAAAGLALAAGYLGLTLVFQQHAAQRFQDELARQQRAATRTMVAPTPGNSVLWFCLAESGDGYWFGYASLLDADRRVDFVRIDRRSNLLAGLADCRAVDRLIWYADGYYAVRPDPAGGVDFHVLKFGLLAADAAPTSSVFSYRIESAEHGSRVVRLARPPVDGYAALNRLWRRLLGHRP